MKKFILGFGIVSALATFTSLSSAHAFQNHCSDNYSACLGFYDGFALNPINSPAGEENCYNDLYANGLALRREAPMWDQSSVLSFNAGGRDGKDGTEGDHSVNDQFYGPGVDVGRCLQQNWRDVSLSNNSNPVFPPAPTINN